MKRVFLTSVFTFVSLMGFANQDTPSAVSEGALKASESTENEPKTLKEQTLSIIKPDAVCGNHIGEILSRFEKAGLRIVAIKSVFLTKEQAEKFYASHKDRPFFQALVQFMSSGPAIVLVLEGENSIGKNRELMGAMDYRKAAPGTIRADFAQSIRKNCVHGSMNLETAKTEISFFFKPEEIFSR